MRTLLAWGMIVSVMLSAGCGQRRAGAGDAQESAPPTDTVARPLLEPQPQPATEPQEEAPPAEPAGSNDDDAQDAEPTQAPDEPAASTTAKESWRIREGPLDDIKFIHISAKYAAAVASVPENQRTSEAMKDVLDAILREANVTVKEYTNYADEVLADEDRSQRVADAVGKMLKDFDVDIETGVTAAWETFEEKGRIKPKQKQSTAEGNE